MSVLKERFEAKFVVHESGCWVWKACKNSHGYGNIRVAGKILKAHRVSYELYVGEIEDFCVCHHCDNTSCVNPEHLFLGTPKDNYDDMVTKGRKRLSPVYGEKHGMAKLKDSQVKEILSSAESNQELAKKYGVTYKHIWAIRKRHKQIGA